MTIIDILRRHAAQRPDAVAFRYLANGEDEVERLTFGQLAASAEQIGRHLMELEPPKARVLLCLDSGTNFIKAFLGCQLAGLVPISVDLPRPNRSVERLTSIVQKSGAAAYLTDGVTLPRLRLAGEVTRCLEKLRAHNIDEIGAAGAGSVALENIAGTDLAFIQYSSGTIGNPKGIAISHDNLIHNQLQIKERFGHDEQTRFVGWLPMFHDMGLVGNVLQPLYLGIECTLMSPAHFIQRPIRWFNAITRYRGTTSGGPNFAFDHCVDRIAESELPTIDLSSWLVAFNGAEPIRASTLRRFCERFRSVGFAETTFLPCYGLAEATLFVSGCPSDAKPTFLSLERSALEAGGRVLPAEEAPEEPVELVASGPPAVDQAIRIVDPESERVLDDGWVGEICIAGPNVSSGYIDELEDTNHVFRARVPGSEASYLRTGDLGFLWKAELFVTGRIKDLIIIRGRNIYPQDVEASVAKAHPLLYTHRSAAFSILDEDDEHLVVVHEVARHPTASDEVAAALQDAFRAVIDQFDTTPHDIVLVQPAAIPTTSSGKIQRAKARTAYLERSFRVLARFPA